MLRACQLALQLPPRGARAVARPVAPLLRVVKALRRWRGVRRARKRWEGACAMRSAFFVWVTCLAQAAAQAPELRHFFLLLRCLCSGVALLGCAAQGGAGVVAQDGRESELRGHPVKKDSYYRGPRHGVGRTGQLRQDYLKVLDLPTEDRQLAPLLIALCNKLRTKNPRQKFHAEKK